ncbi:GGDEF domain-containing protein [Sphingomonas fuzhouensis]|uniref:GGDEF domain-containing protein n=1 Tax=Sphingomonas fuzhouensis TaxID=3106033 RepID=UPI002AFDF25F|nr:GGDEF domain-containing protein [Sphingomonas sp. SGZ-02]
MLALDIASLQLVGALSNLLAGAIHWIPGLTGAGRRKWARYWGSGKLLIGASNAVILIVGDYNIAVFERLLNIVMMVGLCLSVHSVAVFGERTMPRPLVAVLAALLLASIALMIVDPAEFRWTFVTLGLTRGLCYLGIVGLAVGIARRERLLTGWIMAAFFATIAPIFLLRSGTLMLKLVMPSWTIEGPLIEEWMIGVALIVLTLTHFSLLLMEAERTQALLREQASRDSLTGALNRFGLTGIEAELQGPCALALIDIDHFKPLNDGQGHATGDAVLRLLVDLAQRELAHRGMVVRIGGDEFACILPGSAQTAAQSFANRLSQRFDRAVAATVDGPLYPSLSIGVVAGMVYRDLDRLMVEADQAMYAIKRTRHAGRRPMAAAG